MEILSQPQSLLAFSVSSLARVLDVIGVARHSVCHSALWAGPAVRNPSGAIGMARISSIPLVWHTHAHNHVLLSHFQTSRALGLGYMIMCMVLICIFFYSVKWIIPFSM